MSTARGGPSDSYRLRPVRFVPWRVAGWSGRRRLEFWQRSGPDPDRVTQLWLAHDDGSANTSIVVGTFSSGDHSADGVDIAEELTIKLVNLGLPDPEVPSPEGFNWRLVQYAEALAAQHQQWPTTPITIGDHFSQLRYTAFAGWWVGMVDRYPIGVYGTGERPSTLTLVRCTDTTPYGFDLAAGVRFVDMQSGSWHRRPSQWHPDHDLV